MVFSLLLPAILACALVSASPMGPDEAVAIRAEDPEVSIMTDSGCYYFASPKCCVPTVCMCLDSRIYEINRDNTNRGLHGCDPPWGFIASSYPQHPSSCCRVALDGSVIEGEEA